MIPKHAPSPWIYYADTPSDESNWYIVTTKNKMRVVANIHIEPGDAMDVANANLIAAAPELLAAAIRLLDVLDSQMPNSRRLEERSGPMGQLRAAIEKAQGEST